MSVEEALRGDGKTLGVGGVGRHPGLAGRQPPVGRIADADEPERLASSSHVSPDDQSSPGVNGAG